VAEEEDAVVLDEGVEILQKLASSDGLRAEVEEVPPPWCPATVSLPKLEELPQQFVESPQEGSSIGFGEVARSNPHVVEQVILVTMQAVIEFQPALHEMVSEVVIHRRTRVSLDLSFKKIPLLPDSLLADLRVAGDC
jgi:hypothetical protein